MRKVDILFNVKYVTLSQIKLKDLKLAQIPKQFKLSPIFPFLDKRKKTDVDIWGIYMRFKKANGFKSNPNTIRDMITAIGELMALHEKSVLLSVRHTDSGYEVDTIIDTSIVLDKGD